MPKKAKVLFSKSHFEDKRNNNYLFNTGSHCPFTYQAYRRVSDGMWVFATVTQTAYVAKSCLPDIQVLTDLVDVGEVDIYTLKYLHPSDVDVRFFSKQQNLR